MTFDEIPKKDKIDPLYSTVRQGSVRFILTEDKSLPAFSDLAILLIYDLNISYIHTVYSTVYLKY